MNLEADWSSLHNLVEKTVKNLEKKNVVHAEAFFTSTQTTEVTIRNSEILTQNMTHDSGVGFRVVVPKKKVGFACTNALDGKSVLGAAERALAIAGVSNEVPDFALPEVSHIPKAKGTCDMRIAETTVEEAIDIAQRAITTAEGYDKRVTVKFGRVIFETRWRGIMSTLGVDCAEQDTGAVIYLGGSGKQDGEVTGSCSDSIFSRTANLEPEKAGENVARMILEMFNPKPLKSFEGPVIFGPEAVSDHLVEVLIDALKGENVTGGRSVWSKKLGGTVASENLTITDNALLEKGFASRSFDDEGYPSQETIVLRNGKLESFLHNATTAHASKMKNTGNASRFAGGFSMTHSIIGNGYRAKPEVYPSNLIIRTGNKTKEKLISEAEKGVLIESMAGFPQAGSGMISAHLSRAFFIQNGEKQYAIKGGMISGIAFDWFNRISETSKDSKQLPNAVAPSLRVEDMKVLGA